jgi:hypothetical protein
MPYVRRVLSLGLVGCVAACGIELSGDAVQDNASSSSSGGSSTGSSSSSSGGSSSGGNGDAGRDTGVPLVDAGPDVKPPPPPQYKWRCAPVAGEAKFTGVLAIGSCPADLLSKCAGLTFSANSNCDKLGETTRTCTSVCEAKPFGWSYTYDNLCTCGL